MPSPTSEADIERVFRAEYGRAVAVLIRRFGSIDIAEDAVQEAFVAAIDDLAGDAAAAEPGRLDHHHRPQPGDRSVAPGGARATTGRPRRRAAVRDCVDRRRRTGKRGAERCVTTDCG